METKKVYDLIIVGAGLSGIGAAVHVKKKNPNIDYCILESRKTLGGTWDLFRYPGIRSDSDMYTLSYSFKPWREKKTISDGPSILKYLNETAKEFKVDQKIQYETKVIESNWNSQESLWEIKCINSGIEKNYKAKFIHMCCGYYDYKEGYTPDFKGFSDYQGKFIHPQQWDETYDYTNKKIVVIGSGATAVTLVPELAKKAKSVTMLQRSPSYVATRPEVDLIAEKIKEKLPQKAAHKVIRFKNIMFSFLFYRYCQRFPNHAKNFLLSNVLNSIGGDKEKMKHFEPKYNPWDQRLCAVVDGDLFKAVKNDEAKIVTDHIDHFTKEGIKLKSGDELKADAIISATGLKLKFLSDIKMSIDNKVLNLTDLIAYKSIMFNGVPNFTMVFGYTNSSWTLKADLVNQWVARAIKHMRKRNKKIIVPNGNPNMETQPFVNLSSGYIQRSLKMMPKQGKKNPWTVYQNYLLDSFSLKVRPLKDKGISIH